MELIKEIQNIAKQIDPAQAVLVTGILVSGLQGLIKKYKEVGKVVNVILSFVLPLVGAVLATLVADGSVLAHYGQVYVVAQACYQAIKAIQRSAVTKELEATTTQNF